MALEVKNLPANSGDTRDVGLILGWEDSLESEMIAHSSILAGKFHGQRSLAGSTVHGAIRVGHYRAYIHTQGF